MCFWTLVLNGQHIPAEGDSSSSCVSLDIADFNCTEWSSPALPCRTATCLSSRGFFHAVTGTLAFLNPNSLRFLKMLLMTLNHQLGVGDVTHCSLRQCQVVFCHTVYTIVVIPLISLGVLAHFRHICKSISRTVSWQS